ncbi:MAG: class I SAM-dependent methyltransferase [Saprospiraceae bacterium]
MKSPYDKHYQTEDLFGEPYPELIEFFKERSGKILNVGCGQGRNAVALARLGFEVTTIDNSIVGIKQLQELADAETLELQTAVADMFNFEGFGAHDYVLLDSMFHFGKKELKKETNFVKHVVAKMKQGGTLVVCVQDTGKKVAILNDAIDYVRKLGRIVDLRFTYVYVDGESDHSTTTPYRLVVAQK